MAGLAMAGCGAKQPSGPWPAHSGPGSTCSRTALCRPSCRARVRPPIFTADPYDPVPTIGGAISSGEPVMRGGAYDQRAGAHVFGARPPYGPLSDRRDVLCFATSPLGTDIEIAGPLELHLWVASDGPDADIHAKLIDLYPPSEDYPQGFAMNLSEGLLRLRYRASW